MAVLRFPRALVLILLVGVNALADAAELPLFDAHIHYNHDVCWEEL
jgi:hypothetical protein